LSEFIQKQNSLAIPRQERGRTPYGLVAIQARQSAQVNRIEQGGSNINQAEAKRTRGLAYHTRLSYPG